MYYGMQPAAFMDPHAAERQMQEYARLQQEDAKRRPQESTRTDKKNNKNHLFKLN